MARLIVRVCLGLFAHCGLFLAGIDQLVQFLQLLEDELVARVLALGDISVALGLLASILVDLVVGLPVALPVVEGRLVEEVLQVHGVL